MKEKLFFSVLSILILFSFVVAQNEESQHYQSVDDFLNDLNKINSQLQENQPMVPQGMDFIIKNGNIAVKISKDNGDETDFYLTIENKIVLSVSKGLPEKSSYDILSDEETVNKIFQADDFGDEFMSAYNNGKIKIEANGFTNNIKLFIGKIFLKFFT